MPRRRNMKLALVAGGATALIGGGIVTALWAGAFRQPSSQAPPERPGALVISPGGIASYDDGAGQIHYGVWFDLPKGEELGQVRRGCRWAAGSRRHGALEVWELVPMREQPDPKRLRVRMLIPRTWLIWNGFLTPLAAVLPGQEFPLWNRAALMDGFWLERSPHTPSQAPAAPGEILASEETLWAFPGDKEHVLTRRTTGS